MNNNRKRVKVYPKLIKCRTCLGSSELYSCVNITAKCVLGKTIKDILLLFIPQMVKSSLVEVVEDLICSKCAKQVLDFSDFIKSCIRTEHFLIEESIKTQRQLAKDKANGNVGKNNDLIHINVPPSGNRVNSEIQTIQLCPLSTKYLDSRNVSQISLADYTAAVNYLKDQPTSSSRENNSGNAGTKTVQNSTCKTCGDIYTPDIWTVAGCSKCTFTEKNIDTNISDAASISNNGSDDNKEIVENPLVLVKEEHPPDVLNDLNAADHDTVLTVVQGPEEIEDFVHEFSDTIKIVDCPPNNTNSRRLLFLGSSLSQCVTCKGLLQNPKDLKLHFIKAHSNVSVPELDSDEDFEDAAQGNESFDCPFCDVKVGTALLLVEHLRENHRINNPFRCEMCGKEFKKRDQFAEHMKSFKKGLSCGLKKCRYCPQMLSGREYQNHISSHKDIVCDQCGRSFLNRQRFEMHYATHQSDEKQENTPQNEQTALCPICGKLLSKRQSLKHHIATHGQRPRNFICDKCPKTFLTAYSLKTHLSASHVEKKYACPLCNVKVRTHASLMNHHNLKHSQTYSHVCKVCGQGFSRGDYLRRHMARHTTSGLMKRQPGKKKYNYSVKIDPKPAKCKYCLKVFKNVYLLRSHLLCHVKSMRYKCKFCNMTFANTGTRYRHQKRHADPNFELSCTVCWRRMATKEDLERHLARHDDSRKYECEVCESLFASKYLLNHHIVTQHVREDDLEQEKEEILTNALEEYLL